MEPGLEKNVQSLDWLLETESPGVRYLALRDLLHLDDNHTDLIEAQAFAHENGPIAEILAHMQPEGYWVKPGAGYNPKYFSAVWSIILLAQLGAECSMDARITLACSYLLEHALAEGGQFSTTGAPSGTIDCLQGNLCSALLDLGYDDPRLDAAFDWMARSVTGEGIAPNTERNAKQRYYAYKCGPNFACGVNNGLSCAWGAAKVMQAFARLPKERLTPSIQSAIAQGVDFLFSTDPARADWPSGWSDRPSSNWWKFGFPLFYVTDLLQIVEVLVSMGFSNDVRLRDAVDIVLNKRDGQGRWRLEYDYSGKTWVDFGLKKQPNKWVTLRAQRVVHQLQKDGSHFSG